MVPHYILLSAHACMCTHAASNQSVVKDRCCEPLFDGLSPVFSILIGSIQGLTIGITMTQTEGLWGHRPYARLLRLNCTHTHHSHFDGQTQCRNCIIWVAWVCRWLPRSITTHPAFTWPCWWQLLHTFRPLLVSLEEEIQPLIFHFDWK